MEGQGVVSMDDPRNYDGGKGNLVWSMEHSASKAQREGTGKIPHASFVSTQQFARPAELSPNCGHGHHWLGNAESYFLVGDALGKAMPGLPN